MRLTLALTGLALASTAALAQEATKRKAERLVTIDDAKVSEGQKHFAPCVGCHGAEGEGRVGIAPSLTSKSFLEAAGDDLLIRTISAGRAGTTMIPWAAMLTQPQIEAVVAFIRSKQKTEPAELDEAPLKGNADAGAALFASICSTCHGRNGGGYMETVSGSGIGRSGFLNTVSDGYLRYIIKHGKSGTPMKSFALGSKTALANLTDQQIEDIIAHLRANAW